MVYLSMVYSYQLLPFRNGHILPGESPYNHLTGITCWTEHFYHFLYKSRAQSGPVYRIVLSNSCWSAGHCDLLVGLVLSLILSVHSGLSFTQQAHNRPLLAFSLQIISSGHFLIRPVPTNQCGHSSRPQLLPL